MPVSARLARMSANGKAQFIEPMLLQRTDALPRGDDWLYELKLDGYRAIASRHGASFISDRGTTMTSRSVIRACLMAFASSPTRQ